MKVASDVADSLKVLRQAGAFAPVPDLGLIEVYGVDAAKFLQAQTTNDVLSLPEGGSQQNCLLDRKGKTQAFFSLYRKHNSYRLLAERFQIQRIIGHLEQFHFSEKVEFLDLTNDGTFIAIHGPKCVKVLMNATRSDQHAALLERDLIDLKIWNLPIHVLKKNITGEPGVFLWCPVGQYEALYKELSSACQSEGLIELSAEAAEVARIESGLLRFGRDFDADTFLPETGIDEQVVSYTKGCFLGQEVLARVKAQGAPAQGVIGLKIDDSHTGGTNPIALTSKPSVLPAMHEAKNSTSTLQYKNDGSSQSGKFEIFVHNEKIGHVTSLCYSPTLNSWIAIAYLKRELRVPDSALSLRLAKGPEVTCHLQIMPFLASKPLEVQAKELYESALQSYAAEVEPTPHSACIAMLRQALELDPKLEDAYEILGVILSKVGLLDDAIALTKKLVELNADSVMAHTNLSVFYVEKGMIEAAEEEKAISMSIRMRLAVQQMSSEKEESEKLSKLREDTEARMQMFREVLSIDEDDLLANYGVGSCAVDLGMFEDAVPYLQKALTIKPSYTVAYVALGDAFRQLQRLAEARETYKNGIAVASKRGDMTPLKDMQLKLLSLPEEKHAE